ncbi:MAG: hypothetical protein WDZ82_01750 [Candidatus Paceibacterota bacterium]
MLRTPIIIAVALLVAGGIGYAVLSQTNTSIPIQDEFSDKVVYTIDLGVDTQPLIEDCSERGGEFSECGSVCEPEAEMCASVCAYTCDGIPERN